MSIEVIVVAVVLVIGYFIHRYLIAPATFDRLPIAADERVLLREEGTKLWHAATGVKPVWGRGGTTTHGVTVVLTDRRMLAATGGPEGKHKFWMQMVVDYTAAPPAAPVSRGAKMLSAPLPESHRDGFANYVSRT